MIERRTPPQGGSVRLAHTRVQFERLMRHLGAYAAVTALLSGAMLLVSLVNLFFEPSHLPPGFLSVWVLSYLILTAAPLVFGHRYPGWAGLVATAYLVLWSTHLLVTATHDHVFVGALLQLPVLAMYLGWFWLPWGARLAMFLALACIVPAALFGNQLELLDLSRGLTVGYAILISWFCLETASVVRRRAEWQASHDPLTGVLNRRGLTRFGGHRITQALRDGTALALAVIDFDDFKAVNDAEGHTAGDRALQAVAQHWVSGLGVEDLVVRTGGDEFVVVAATPKAELGERLHALHATSPFAWTFGACELRAGDTLDSLMARADEALYAAKDTGR